MVVPTRLLKPRTLLERLVPYTMKGKNGLWLNDESAIAWVAGLKKGVCA